MCKDLKNKLIVEGVLNFKPIIMSNLTNIRVRATDLQLPEDAKVRSVWRLH